MSATVPSASDRESSRMKLLFHGSGDHNGNAFQFSSSSSSSHSSPESLHSPVRLHIGQEESPEEDYDVLEFTLTTAMREDEQMVMISKWVQDENMMAVKTLSGEMSEENSVYLDANQFCSESWNCTDRTDADDSPSKTNSLPSSSTPDSDATEVPAADDEDDDLEEALFVSVSSDVVAGTGVILMKLLDSELVLAGQTGMSERKSEPSNSPCLTCPDPEMSKSTSVSTKPFESSQAARETSTKQLTGSLTRTTPYHHNRTRMFDPTKGSKTDLANGKTKTTSTHSPTKPGQNKLEKKTAGQTKPHLSQPMLGKNKEVRTIAQPKRTSDGKVSAPGDPESSRDSIVQTVQAEPQHMNQDLKNAETIGESKQEQRSPYRKVKLGPGPRSFGRSLRASDKEAAPGAGTGPPGPGRPRQSQRPDVSTSVKEESGSCSSALKPGPCVGVPKPSPATMAVLNLTLPKASANQQRAAFGGDSQLPPAPLSKLPVKGLSTGAGPEITNSKGAPGSGSKMNERGSKSTFPAGGHKAGLSTSDPSDTVAANASLKPPAMRIRAQSLQARTMTTGLKSPSIINHNVKLASVHPAAAKIPPTATPKTSPLQRSGSARLSRASSTVDKNKSRDIKARSTTGNNNNNIALVSNNNNHQASDQAATHVTPTVTGSSGATPGLRTKAKSASRSAPETVPSPQNVSKPGKAAAADRTLAPEPTVEAEKKNQAVVQLKRLLVQGNRRVEALATVVQHLFREHEEALKQKKELSLQLINLRDELVVSSQCCERLHKEKEEVQVSLKETLRKLQEQHKEDLVQLESRLRNFYQAEWDKVHESYQEEADKCRVIVEKQVDDMRSHYRAELTSQEEAHSQKMEDIRQQHQRSTQELNVTHQNQLQNLQKNLRETEASLSEQISELSAERRSLLERLQEEEEWRRTILSDKNLDPHTVYLRQELDSLKVVLELKNEQLHVKEKRLLEMDKLVETNVKLEECFKKVQQENEDYKARMDKHAALSKQLSSEQVKLQQTLQKESKVNKRLSMENEELLWKLHNGDLFPASPRRLSPTSPFASPRNSASFPTAAPVSPR